jgi:diguanylate cyclase (GGDEF)-like protein
MRTSVVPSSASIHQQIAQQRPDVILLDLDTATSLDNGLQLVAQLQAYQPPIPVLVLATPEHHSSTSGGLSLRQRLDVARSGGRTILQKPVSTEQILNAVDQILQQGTVTTSKVLAVDDDCQVLAMLRSLLTPWGLSVMTLDQPQQFWETLEATEPDLLILDIEMPTISGIELCQVVRNDPRWSSLPIMILTAHTDAAMVNQVFAAGVDDFVSKPIVGPELVTRTINRLERTRFLKQWAEVDPLTRVSNRHKSTQDLNQFLYLAKQHNQPVCIAVIDLDNFKQINDRYGHATGDRVLQDVGQLLHRSFRNDDVIARWGGEEFVIGMYGIQKRVGVKRLESLLQELRHHEFPIAHCDSTACQTIQLHITFSGGVAEYPDDGDNLHALYQCADAVLYQARAAGRDRVLCAGY